MGHLGQKVQNREIDDWWGEYCGGWGEETSFEGESGGWGGNWVENKVWSQS